MDDETHKKLSQMKLDYDAKRIGTVIAALVFFASSRKSQDTLEAYCQEVERE